MTDSFSSFDISLVVGLSRVATSPREQSIAVPVTPRRIEILSQFIHTGRTGAGVLATLARHTNSWKPLF